MRAKISRRQRLDLNSHLIFVVTVVARDGARMRQTIAGRVFRLSLQAYLDRGLAIRMSGKILTAAVVLHPLGSRDQVSCAPNPSGPSAGALCPAGDLKQLFEPVRRRVGYVFGLYIFTSEWNEGGGVILEGDQTRAVLVVLL